MDASTRAAEGGEGREVTRGPAATGNDFAVRDSAFTVVANGRIHTVQQAPEALPAFLDDAPGTPLEDWLPAAVASRLRHALKSALRTRRFVCEEVADAEVCIEFTAVPQGRDRVLVLLRDVSEHSHALAEMQELAYRDDVTQLPNARYLERELETILSATRLTDGRVALICLHVDQVTSQGIASAVQRQDDVLREVAVRLGRELRRVNEGDPVDYERYSAVARTDFRQFAVVLPSIEDGGDAEAVAQRLLATLREPIELENGRISVGVHAGIALYPQDGRDARTLLDNAGAAVDDARGSDTDGGCRFYSGTARLRALQRKDIEVQLRAALDAEAFDIHYQPIVSAENYAPESLEALLRWPTTLVATRSIARIVALAEHTGLIGAIGAWVLRRACLELRALHDAGHVPLRLAVNLSVQELFDPALPDTVAAVLAEAGVDASLLDFEITEYMLFRDSMKNYAGCRALKELGVGIVIDDFGTGACSLGHVAHAPVDALKIGRAFVAGAPTSPRDLAACAASARLADSLGLGLVGTGVETEEQAALLREAGCGRLQGFLFSRPLAAEALPGFLDPAGDRQYRVGRHE